MAAHDCKSTESEEVMQTLLANTLIKSNKMQAKVNCSAAAPGSRGIPEAACYLKDSDQDGSELLYKCGKRKNRHYSPSTWLPMTEDKMQRTEVEQFLSRA